MSDLISEARKLVTLSEHGSGKIRLLEVTSNKIGTQPHENVLLETLTAGGTRAYRLEEVPCEDLNLAEDELLIPVAHFHKESFSTFGIPFLLKMRQGEPYSSVKQRIQKKLDIPDKEFEKVCPFVNGEWDLRF